VLKLIESYGYEEVCLEFLAEAGRLRDEISLMSDGSAFQARDTAMENDRVVTGEVNNLCKRFKLF